MFVRTGDDQRGDTIVEVLFAMSVLAAVITITISLMNAGFAGVMASMDRTNVQALMNGQASLLRASRDRYAQGDTTAGWSTIIAPAISGGYVNTVVPITDACKPTAQQGPRRFYLNPSAATPWVPVDRSTSPTKRVGTLPSSSDGMWVEVYKKSPPSGPAYYDFYIKSCWTGYGSKAEQQTRIVVRLYDVPAGVAMKSSGEHVASVTKRLSFAQIARKLEWVVGS